MRIVRIAKKIYWSVFKSPEAYARHVGVKLGNGCLVGTRHWGSEPYLITVGDNVQLTEEIYFHTHGGSHVVRDVVPDFDVFGKIEVKDGAYIGSCSHIMPGVTIGKGALIAAGSIVTKSVPDREVWGGVPARRICSVDEYLERNKRFNLGTKGKSADEKKSILMEAPDDKFIRK